MKLFNWFTRIPLIALFWQWLFARWFKRRVAAQTQETQIPASPKRLRKIARLVRLLWDSQMRGTYRRPFRKIGRNELCPCHSGLKHKRCCGK